MFYIQPTEKWIDEVVNVINENRLNPEDSKFMMAFFSSMDSEFVDYFLRNKMQISSFSGHNFHIFTPLIFEEKVIPDEEWRTIRNEFKNSGIPISTEPTFIFFNISESKQNRYEPHFFAGFECTTFNEFPRKLKNAIDKSIEIKNTNQLSKKLIEVFCSKNIIPIDKVDNILRETISCRLPQAKIFISHSSIDKPFVHKLSKELSKDSSLKFWIDENEILAGNDIQETISRSLKEMDYLLLVISENSIKSPWVNFEVSQFIGFAENNRVIPIILSKGQKFSDPINNLIRRLKYIDFSNEKNWNESITSIKLALSKKTCNESLFNEVEVNFNDAVDNAVIGNNNKITINQIKKKVVQKYPENCIGADTVKANYIGYLIERYNVYKKYELAKDQVNYSIFASHLKRRYKIAPTRTLYNLHINKFDELSSYIQSRIDQTKLAKIKGKGHKNYSTFEEFEKEQR
jgi:TIR domain.